MILIIESLLYIITYIQSVTAGNPLEKPFQGFYKCVLNNNICGIYWYLYAYLGLLFMLPFMQRIVSNISKQDFFVLIILHFVFSSLIPLVNIALIDQTLEPINICNDFSVPLATSAAFFYPLIGYYIDHKIDVSIFKLKHILSLLLLGALGIIFSCWCICHEAHNIGIYTQNYVSLFCYVIAISVFLLVKYLVTVAFPKLDDGKIGKVISLLGSLTFGIYLLDPILKTIFYGVYAVYIEQFIPTFLASVYWMLISMFVGGLITNFLKQIPLLKKII